MAGIIAIHVREIEINLTDDADIESRIERAIARADLSITMKGTLAGHPGCTHWHIKRGRETGTLEITWSPAAGRAWFSIQSARAAPWIDEVLPALKRQIESSRSSNA